MSWKIIPNKAFRHLQVKFQVQISFKIRGPLLFQILAGMATQPWTRICDSRRENRVKLNYVIIWCYLQTLLIWY